MKGKENSMEPLIRVSHVRKIYRMGTEKIVALDDVSLDINRGDIVCLLGASGSGKSTFLNMLAGLEKPTRGEIWVGKVPVHKLNEEQVTLFRQKNIGFIFQAYNLMNAMTAEENVSLPLLFRGMAKEERLKRARRAMATVGLKGLEKRRPNQMSGGQQQRVGIARAIVGTPKIIFADEPTGNLDSVTTKEVMELIIDQVRTHKQTLILVTHDQSIASYADIIVTIRDGNIIHIDRKDPPPEEGAALASPPGGALPEDTNEPEQTAEPNRKEGTEE